MARARTPSPVNEVVDFLSRGPSRADRWTAHFRLDGAQNVPLMPVARGRARLLRFNDEQRVLLRAELLRQGRFTLPRPW